ncbi:MAG: RagB/SusD family nutrient uptake outer membrane protein, partial [Bacteroidia bacterium]|nr:RagB/SusD family nutrient uptake outer membrane protein [Bacteroidia bacterium]
NHTTKEVIFTSKNINGVEMGGIRTRWYMGAHYNQTPGGWNGFSILGEFYDTFDSNDRRIKNDDSGIISAFGNPMGMQIGQQYAPGGVTKLKVRAQAGGGDLIFDKNLPANQIVAAEDLETAGVRPQKYIPDVSNLDKPENDYVFFRYADALLMKAEALARGGSATAVAPVSASAIAAALDSRTGITTPTDLSSLAGILKARGNELWAEGWRRNDMIRFGTYTTSRRTMTNTDGYRVLMPIPASALINPNIQQNPGY